MKWISLQENLCVLFFLLKLVAELAGAAREGTPTQAMNFLLTRRTTTLCCRALVVIKNRPLPFGGEGPVAFRSILCSTPFPEGGLGGKVLLPQHQLRAKGWGGGVLSCSCRDNIFFFFVDFSRAHKNEMRKGNC